MDWKSRRQYLCSSCRGYWDRPEPERAGGRHARNQYIPERTHRWRACFSWLVVCLVEVNTFSVAPGFTLACYDPRSTKDPSEAKGTTKCWRSMRCPIDDQCEECSSSVSVFVSVSFPQSSSLCVQHGSVSETRVAYCCREFDRLSNGILILII